MQTRFIVFLLLSFVLFIGSNWKAQTSPDKNLIENQLKLSVMNHPEFEKVNFNVEVNDNIVNFYSDIETEGEFPKGANILTKVVIVIGNFTSLANWKSENLYIKINGSKFYYLSTKNCRKFVNEFLKGNPGDTECLIWIAKNSNPWD